MQSISSCALVAAAWDGRRGPCIRRLESVLGIDSVGTDDAPELVTLVPWLLAPERDRLVAGAMDVCALHPLRTLILIGRTVARAFGATEDVDLPAWVWLQPTPAARERYCFLMPHPSDRCRWWHHDAPMRYRSDPDRGDPRDVVADMLEREVELYPAYSAETVPAW